MKKLPKSSFLGLFPGSREDISEYIRGNLKFMKDAGFDVANIGTGLLVPTTGQWQPIVEQAQKDAAELSIPFSDCHLPYFNIKVNTDPDYAELCSQKMHTAIDIAKALHVRTAVLHPNCTTVTMRAFDRKEAYDVAMAHLSPFAEYAAKVGLNIVIENTRLIPGIRQSHRFCQGPEELCEVADALGFGVCWDFGHANLAGFKQSEALAYVGKRLKAIHVHDNNGTDDDHIAPFMGNVDWKDAMHGLALAEFDGPLNYEVGANRIPESLRQDFARYLVDAADQLMEYII